MIKILILYVLGRKVISPRSLFNLIKSYFILYLLILPGFLTAQTFEWVKTKSIDFAMNYELVGSQVINGPNNHVTWIALEESLEIYGQYIFMVMSQSMNLTVMESL